MASVLLAIGWIRLIAALAAYDPSSTPSKNETSDEDAPEDAAATSEAPSDNTLMLRYANEGDVDAFDQLVSRYEDQLLHFILKRTDGQRAAAEDILQETFLRVVDNAQEYEASHAFSTWLYTIARNLCIDRTRRASHNRTESLDAPLGGDPSADQTRRDRLADDDASSTIVEHDRQTFRQQLSDALDALPDEQREVFLLREISGLSYPEIAEVIDVAVGTAKSRMRYALQSLRRHLEAFENHSFDHARREQTAPNDE